MFTHSAERRAAVKAGCKPVHFSLDGCLLSCYFSGSVATLRDTLSTSRSVGRGTGAFIYLPPFSENRPIFCSFPFAKIQPVFLPEQTGCKKHRTPFPPSATPAGITLYTLQAKSCANGGKPPLETPTRKGGMLPSSTGAHTAFSCYPALRLYRLSKSQRGIGVVSLTLRYPAFLLGKMPRVRNITTKKQYRQRHKIENMFSRLKDWRRIATRYDCCAHTFLSAIHLAAIVIFYL